MVVVHGYDRNERSCCDMKLCDKATIMSTQDNIDSLEEEALKRKERLKALKRKHDEASKDGDKSEGSSTEGMASLPRLVRNAGVCSAVSSSRSVSNSTRLHSVTSLKAPVISVTVVRTSHLTMHIRLYA